MLAPVWAFAQSELDDRISIRLGAFFTDRETNTQINSDALGSGAEIDFEDDLGLESSDSVFRLDSHYRFNEKHRADFSVFDLSRDSSATIQRDIQFGDEIFLLDAVVTTNFDLRIHKLAYTYSVMRRDHGYLGLSIGVHIADSTIGLSEQNLGQTEIRSITAPLPVLGIKSAYEITDRLTLNASGEFLVVEFDNVEGSLVDLYLDIDYQIIEHVAIGVGFNSVDIDVDANKSDFSGTLDWRYDGALVFFKIDF